MKKEREITKSYIKLNKGITLIALVITIIVLLILAGVSITMLTGENGILKKAKEAQEKTKVAAEQEEKDLAKLNKWLIGEDDGIKVNFNGYTPNTWTNQDITVTIPYQDSYSGVDPTNVVYKLSETETEYKDWSSTPTANQATKKWARTNRQLVMYIVVTDRAGNTSKVCNNSPCRTNIYQDITPPTVYRHCFHQKTSNEYQFYMYMKDDGGSNIDVYRWRHCYSYCPRCSSKSYLCSYKSAYTRMAEADRATTIQGKASHIRITHYNIFPSRNSRITVNSRMQIKDRAGNIYTSPSDIVHTYYYNGSTDPGRC